MHLDRAIRALGPIDLKSVGRDAMLRWLVLLPVLLALLLRWGTPLVTARLGERFGFDLVPYYPLLASFMVVTVPMLAGFVIGFLLLDQRDDGTLSALQVTPLGLTGYLVYRIAAPMLVAVTMSVVSVPLTGLAPLGLGRLILVAVVAAPLAPLAALALAGFASNKVQGFALMKAAGVLNWPPMIAWFVPVVWQWVMGIVPTYWSVKLFWMLQAGERGAAPYAVVGLAYPSLLTWLLLKRFHRVMTR